MAEHVMCLLSAMAARPANFADCKWWGFARKHEPECLCSPNM
jgi:hypothetical protein